MTTAHDTVLAVSDAALSRVLEIRAQESDGEVLGLRIEVTGTRGVDYTYDLAFEPFAEALDGDAVFQVGELTVVVPADSIEKLRGATLDLPSNANQGGLVIRNPNRPDPMAHLGPLELSGDIAEKVGQLLEQRINPSLAAHGGYATLVGVDDTVVYITMGGGCQGCAMSQLTLTEGIKAQIVELIPEVTEVRDATDHASGANPYYS
ncbi:MAG: NifU family protein [Acidimicrobiales bacterium]|jgi:Fe/S biogenesis protein NfuA|nr:NifU family protein [Acidimicrobiales bacterium]